MKYFSILWVEGDLTHADRVTDALDSFVEIRFSVRRVQTHAGALEVLERHRLDLILLAPSLQEDLERDLRASIRICAPQTPVIVLTRPEVWDTAEFTVDLRQKLNFLQGLDEPDTGFLPFPDGLGERVREVRPVSLVPMAMRDDNSSIEDSALRAAEKERTLLAAAVSSAHDPVIITDRYGTIRYVNPAFSRETGYTQQEVLGSNPRILQSGEHDRSFFVAMYRSLSECGEWNGHLINRRKNGATFRVDATITCQRDEQGEIESYVMVSRDVTDFTELQRQLNQSMRLNAIGQLAGGIAHDFNNVLQVILSYGSFLMDETRSEEHRRFNEYAVGICDAAKRASSLTGQLLAFGRKQPLRTECVDLNILIQSATHLVDRLIGEHIILVLSLEPELPHVHVDPTQIEQIVMNLCVNARDAMPRGGKIAISTVLVELGCAFCQQNAWATPGQFVRLLVADTGAGMSPDVLEHIFEPFFTTKDEVSGTGMGLASVYGIVKQQKGLIHCESTPGKGTALSIYFPVAEKEENDAAPVLSEPVTEGGRSARILIAEDDLVVATLARTLLEGAGFQVTVAPDGHAAFQELLLSEDSYELVLSDVIMPRTSGVELMELVMGTAGIAPKPKFLLCSGYSPGVLERTTGSRTSFEFLQKPYSPAELLMTVRSMLNKE